LPTPWQSLAIALAHQCQGIKKSWHKNRLIFSIEYFFQKNALKTQNFRIFSESLLIFASKKIKK